MRKLLTSFTIVLVGMCIFFAAPVAGQTVANTSDWSVLNVLWRVQVPKSNGVDYMTTNGATERDLFTSDGAIFYVPKDAYPNTAILYRLYAPTMPDHMESTLPNEGGYQSEGPIGYPWAISTILPGLTRIVRPYNPTNLDHATAKEGETLPISGYTQTGPFERWGYARYNNLDDSQTLLSLTSGGVTVDSNKSAGGCVWQWTYRGVQYINHEDYGREMQSVFFFYDNVGRYRNPTECGDGWSNRQMAPQTRHGSPMVTGYNNANTQVTRAVPLDWFFNNFPGGGQNNPVLDQDLQLGKDLQLNFNNMGPVGMYTTQVYARNSIDLAGNALYIPTIYLTPNFNQYYFYDAGRDVLTNTTSITTCPGSPASYRPGPGDSGYAGAIVSDASGVNAMGLFGMTFKINGDVEVLKLVNGTCGAPNVAQSVISAAYKGVIPAGWSHKVTWVMTGSVTEVRNYMRQLYFTLAGSNKPSEKLLPGSFSMLRGEAGN